MSDWQDFHGPNAGYVAELYERYRRTPDTLDAATRAFFSRWQPPVAPAPAPAAAVPALAKVVAAANLAQAIRAYGHLAAQLDPLGSPPHGDPALDPATHGLSEADLAALPASIVGGPAAAGAANALAAIAALRRVYCHTTGYEFDHIHDAAERAWLREAVETGRYLSEPKPIDERRLLARLSEVEGFERYLHRTFPGQTRFSIEGLDVLIPMLDEAVGHAAASDICEVLIAMAHRGRLNVLAHVLGKPYSLILAEFAGASQQGAEVAAATLGGWTGDVKYHMGARKAYQEDNIVNVLVTMPPNPSHLESINPVVEGMARAADEVRNRPGPPAFHADAALPIIIHGDAAFSGQGVVAETINFSALDGYATGGTIHIIANNQLGFTAEPQELRSTLYASDLAKGFEIPIVHVTADDPPACLAAIRLASAYRQRFHRDFLIDLVGYRRWGHNEGDQPAFTQPLMYQAIAQHPTVRELWAKRLIEQGLVREEEVEAMAKEVGERLREARAGLARAGKPDWPPPPPPRRGPDGAWADRVQTALPLATLLRLNDELHSLPEGFTPNRTLLGILQRRRAARAPESRIDWSHAEALAFASILAEGTAIRLTGQDAVRGTFSQRHLALVDQQSGRAFLSLQHLPSARASFAAYNSPLSENAAVGFEYGYSVHAPATLVLWEAQYGDFANGAQVIVDQFVVSGHAKWGVRPSLVLLLPHGYEGQGPEHSSARLERFLELAAEDNLRVANCTTAAQYFHLLRLQAALLRTDPRPLVLLTPKSLLRLPEAASQLGELTTGSFQPLIDDAQARARAHAVTRLVLCSGKVYYDLASSEARQAASALAVARLEQLYPFPAADLESLFAGYPRLQEVVWLQEEPENMGAWGYLAPRLRDLLPAGVALTYAGRPPRASPAEGNSEWHAMEQARIVALAARGSAKPQRMIRGARYAG